MVRPSRISSGSGGIRTLSISRSEREWSAGCLPSLGAIGGGSRGTRTHKRPAAAACFQDRSLIQPDGCRQCWLPVKFRGLESNQRPPRSERGVTTSSNCPGIAIGSDCQRTHGLPQIHTFPALPHSLPVCPCLADGQPPSRPRSGRPSNDKARWFSTPGLETPRGVHDRPGVNSAGDRADADSPNARRLASHPGNPDSVVTTRGPSPPRSRALCSGRHRV